MQQNEHDCSKIDTSAKFEKNSICKKVKKENLKSLKKWKSAF